MNILQRIKDGAGKMTDRAQNVVEIGKLNTQISNIEREMGLYFQRMGEVFYERYRSKDMSEAETEMVELAKTCDLLAEERDELRFRIAELKNERLCGDCGKNVSEDALFCQYCGHKLEKHVPVPAKTSPHDEAVGGDESTHKVNHHSFKPEIDELNTSEPVETTVKSILEESGILEQLRETAEPKQDDRHLRNLEREQERQKELDLRIRSWRDDTDHDEPVIKSGDTAASAATVSCQICSKTLVKGTKWCPHCGNEQI